MSELDLARHIQMQKNIVAGYSISSIAKGEPSVDKAIQLMIRKLNDCADTKTVMNFGEWYLYFTFDVVGRVTFYKPFGLLQEGRAIGNAIAIGEYLERYMGFIGNLPWVHNILMENPFMHWLGVQP